MQQKLLAGAIGLLLFGATSVNAAYEWPYPANSSAYVGTGSILAGKVGQQNTYGRMSYFIVAFNRKTGKTYEVKIASSPIMNLAAWWNNYLNDVPSVRKASHSADLKTLELVVGGSGACFKYTAKLSGETYMVPPSGTNTRFGARTPCK